MGEIATENLSVTRRERRVAQFQLEVIGGPDLGKRLASECLTLSVGTAPANHLVLADPTVSRHHCQIEVDARGFLLRDLDSTNRTFVGTHAVTGAYLVAGSTFRIGHSTLRFDLTHSEIVEPFAEQDTLGGLLGASTAMRRMFYVLERVIPTDATILLEGETGTGKTQIAEAISAHGPRAGRPFVVVDCATMSPTLIEAELFGYERGAFTGATTARAGLFEAADTGTIFLDEIGELSRDLQPKLLRVLEARTVTRIGSTHPIKLDVRVIAATHRDLRVEVNRGAFRSDLFYRLGMLRIEVPPLRDRREDIPLLVTRFYRELAGPESDPPPDLLIAAANHRWPGNVRELRSFVERRVVLGPQPIEAASDRGGRDGEGDDGALSFRDAKARAVSRWERGWLERLVATHAGSLAAAARASGIDRNYLRELLQRHGLRGAPEG